MMKSLFTIAFFATATTASAWTFTTEKDDQGDIYVVEQVGEGGAIASWVCIDSETALEVMFPNELPEEDTALLFQVDNNAELLIAGFVEVIDVQTSVFFGIDRTDKPAIATGRLMSQAKAGNALYLGDPDLQEAIERWPLRGLTASLAKLESACS